MILSSMDLELNRKMKREGKVPCMKSCKNVKKKCAVCYGGEFYAEGTEPRA